MRRKTLAHAESFGVIAVAVLTQLGGAWGKESHQVDFTIRDVKLTRVYTQPGVEPIVQLQYDRIQVVVRKVKRGADLWETPDGICAIGILPDAGPEQQVRILLEEQREGRTKYLTSPGPWTLAEPCKPLGEGLLVCVMKSPAGIGFRDTVLLCRHKGALASPVGVYFENTMVLDEIKRLRGGEACLLTWFCEGAEHVLRGKLGLAGYVFDSDPNYPLTFKFSKERGYVRLCGRGKVVTPDKKTLRIGDDETVGQWVKRLSSAQQLEREGAAQALGWLARDAEERREAATALVDALCDGAASVRRSAAESLGRLGEHLAAEPLRNALARETDSWARAVMSEALQKLEQASKGEEGRLPAPTCTIGLGPLGSI